VGLLLIAAALIAGGYAVLGGRQPLEAHILDVTGYTENVKIWMPFRVTLGLTNRGRDLLTLRRIHVEPDFENFSETFNEETYQLDPPLLIEPGSSISYQAAFTLLNASQLQDGSHAMVFRVVIEQDNGRETRLEFPAIFDQTPDPANRKLQF